MPLCHRCDSEMKEVQVHRDFNLTGTSFTETGVEVEGYAKTEPIWWCPLCHVCREPKEEEGS